jgi:cobalamin biosynthesis protein CobT
MKAIGIISTAALSLLLGMAAAPLYAQEQHEEQKDQQEQKDKPAVKPEEKRALPEQKKAEEAKPAQQQKAAQEEKNSKQEEKSGQQHAQQAKSGQQEQHNRIPDDKFRANFGREHTFRVSEGDYRNHRFAYGGYSFGFVGIWPSNWLYTQDVFVVDIDGVYYLCNPVYPGVNLALSFTL